jgi:hypothetical protein
MEERSGTQQVAGPIGMSLRELYHDDAQFSSPNGPFPTSSAPLLFSHIEDMLNQKQASVDAPTARRRLPSFPDKRYPEARSAHITAHRGQDSQ